MRLSAEAMNAALADFQTLDYQSQVAAAYEAFLTAKWVEIHEGGDLPTFGNVGRAVPAVFGVLASNELGRLAPFHYDWLTLNNTGRKTVWNNNSRGGNKKSLTLFANNDIRSGLTPNAATTLGALLPANRPSWQSLAVLVARDHEFQDGDDWPAAQAVLTAELGLTQGELASITSNAPLGVSLLASPAWDESTIPEALGPGKSVSVQAPVSTPTPGAPSAPPPVTVSMSIDTRVERMLRLALATSSSILLVGPPGTGKGTLLKWALGELAASPDRYGFEAGFNPNPLWRTPDESWSAFDLIGGLAPDEHGVLKWSDGALLNAIEANRWLVLDETNRCDMDKIMGPLLTWLSDQEVEVGRSASHNGTPMHVGWSAERTSTVENDGGARRYLAGTDFRLLGTYNPQDAQRVFRFGQALSRRFVVIPVPAIRPGQFAKLLGEAYPALGEQAVTALTSLYAAHLADDSTALGPAVFLRMAKYLIAGTPATNELLVAPVELAADIHGAANASAGDVEGDADEPTTPLMAELLAEAYVIGVGRYLAGYDDRTFGALGERIVNDESVLQEGQWSWVTAQRNVLS